MTNKVLEYILYLVCLRYVLNMQLLGCEAWSGVLRIRFSICPVLERGETETGTTSFFLRESALLMRSF